MIKIISYIIGFGLIYGCINQTPKDKTSDFKRNFYYDEERKVFADIKYNADFIQVDTAFLYKDSLKKRLIELNTIITKNSHATINQIIHYAKDGSIDTSNSYFYSFNYLNEDSIVIQVSSQYNDTIYLEIGELNNNYENEGRVDSFPFVGNKLIIERKAYYQKGRIGVWEYIPISDSTYPEGSYRMIGKELYVPEKFLKN